MRGMSAPVIVAGATMEPFPDHLGALARGLPGPDRRGAPLVRRVRRLRHHPGTTAAAAREPGRSVNAALTRIVAAIAAVLSVVLKAHLTFPAAVLAVAVVAAACLVLAVLLARIIGGLADRPARRICHEQA
jgi:hypothetical protein